MIFLIGSGSRRTSVGTARIWSPRASCGVLQEIDDLDLAAQQVLLANLLQVLEGQHRLRRLSRDVEPERVGLPCGRRRGRPVSDNCMASPFRRTGFDVIECPVAPAASSRCNPWFVITNSHSSFECAMPRDLSTYNPRGVDRRPDRSPARSRCPSGTRSRSQSARCLLSRA